MTENPNPPLAEQVAPEPEFADARERYARACEAVDEAYAWAEHVEAEWTELGKPMLAIRGTGALVEHPLVDTRRKARNAIRETEKLAAQLGQALGLDPVGAQRVAGKTTARPKGSNLPKHESLGLRRVK